MTRAWSSEEVREIVADYFEMLRLELAGEEFNKAARLRVVASRLKNRSRGSIEYKRQNISAALIQLRRPWVSGYKPAWNYQGILLDAIAEHLEGTPEVVRAMERDADRDVPPVDVRDILSGLNEPPMHRRGGPFDEGTIADPETGGRPMKRIDSADFLAREARNRTLGLAGEGFVIEYEKARLASAHKERLAERIEHVSLEQGDGAGFDIRSFETNGADRFIEVKTTGYGKETPFFVTANELGFSRRRSEQYELYRVFLLRIKRKPGLFTLHGAIEDSCTDLRPTHYVVRV